MISSILEILSIFDWITPTKGLIEDIINDFTPLQSNSWTFFIPVNESPYGPNEISKMMSQYGIKTWGHQLTGGDYFFSVKMEQARWAEYVLARKSIPLWYASEGVPRPSKKSWGKMSQEEKQQRWKEEIDQTREDIKYYSSLYNSKTQIREEQSLIRSLLKAIL